MHYFLLLAAVLCALSPARTWAQARSTVAPAQTDTILRLNGEEVRGRVLSLTPTELHYQPAAPAAPDTLALPVAEVFLVRYANGTREVLYHAPTETTDPLFGLSAADRQGLGRRDAAVHYRNPGAFWGSAGTALGASPIYGIAAPIVLSVKSVRPDNFQAPDLALLSDPSYQRGYQQQANSTKRRQAWAGYATGTGVWAALMAILIAAVFH